MKFISLTLQAVSLCLLFGTLVWWATTWPQMENMSALLGASGLILWAVGNYLYGRIER